MAHYMFETEWLLSAPVEKVFELISHPEDYSRWWPGVTESRLVSSGDENGVGRVGAYKIRSPLGYKMRFETRTIEIDAPSRVNTVVRGDLVGTGTHYLESRLKGTYVRFDWYVSTTKRWMNAIAGIARPGFAFAHRYVMFNGCDGMAEALGGRLITATSKLVDAPTPVPVTQQ
ncbi:MAG: SRPBCC family protein [Acidimicrobiia bacterium]